MSFRATTWAIDQRGVTALEKLVLIILADRHNNDTNRCDPSMALVAEDCGMSRASVIRCVKSLAKRGLLAIHQRWEGPVQLTNFYTFNMKVLTGVVADSNRGGCTQQPGVVADSNTNQELNPEENRKAAARKKASSANPEAPEWIDKKTFAAFAEMRAKVGKPMTPRARELMAVKLGRMRDAGQDVTAVLEQSILNSWTDVYEVKDGSEKKSGSGGNKIANNLEVLRRVRAKREADRGSAGDDGVLAAGDDDGRILDELLETPIAGRPAGHTGRTHSPWREVSRGVRDATAGPGHDSEA